MPIHWRDVYSSSANRVGYDPDLRELYVEWARFGRVSVYEGVEPEVFDKLSKAPSVGTMLFEDIKPKYKHHYVK